MDSRDLITLIGVLTGLVGASSALIGSLATYLSFRRDGVYPVLIGYCRYLFEVKICSSLAKKSSISFLEKVQSSSLLKSSLR